jgi:hypothetical protein
MASASPAVTAEFTRQIAAVAPIHGCAIGDTADKATWRIDFRPEATPAQISAAQTVQTNFDYAAEQNKILNNTPLIQQLDTTDKDSIRSLRNVVNTLARLSSVFPPTAGTDQAYLLNAEMSARNARKQLQPPAALSLPDAKAQKIERLRVQGLAYIGIGFIAQTIRWRSTQDQIIYINQCGFLVSGEILLGDGKVHIWDYTGVERALTPLNAGKLVGALNAWLYVAQKEFWGQAALVNACTTNAQVDAITWTTKYNASNLFNADTMTPVSVAATLPAEEPIPPEVLRMSDWI